MHPSSSRVPTTSSRPSPRLRAPASPRPLLPSALLAGLLLTLFAPASATSAPPVLSHLFPAGGQRGSKVAVTATGDLKGAIKAWSPGVDVVVGEAGKLEISIPADLAADRVWMRLYNAEGASALTPFLVGTLPEINDQEPNDKPREAQAIADPHVTVNGFLKDGDVDGFAVTLTAGQTLVAAVDANTRLGSPMDAILQVASPDGFVLAEVHDDVKLDPRLAFTAAKAGTYIVRLFAFPSAPDTGIRFVGGANYIYRLTLTTGPFITHSVPLAVPKASPGTVELRGWNVPAGAKLPVVQFGGPRLADFQELEPLDELHRSPDAQWGFAFSPDLAGAARVRLTPYGGVPTLAQTDPKTPQVLAPSTSVTGCLKMPRQSDVYSVPLKKGQQVMVSVESRGLDLPLDPVVQLADPSGAVVADVDDTGPSRDAAIAHVAARDGDYRVTVSDRYRQGGERGFYLLTVRLDEPDFELSMSADALVVTPGKPAELPVKIQRRNTPSGAVGPITIQPSNLPPGVTAPAVISEPSGPTSTEVKLLLTAAGPPFSGPLRILGKAALPKELERSARTPPKLGAAFETLWLTVPEKPADKPAAKP